MESNESTVEDIHSVFPDMDREVIRLVLEDSHWNTEITVEKLLRMEDPDFTEPEVALRDDFLELGDSPCNYDAKLAEALQAQLALSGNEDEELKRVIQLSLEEAKEEAKKAKQAQKEAKKTGETKTPSSKGTFSRKFKEKMRNLFKRKNKLEEHPYETELEDMEVISFSNPNPSSQVYKGENLHPNK